MSTTLKLPAASRWFAASAGALAVAMTMGLSAPASATECLLDTNNDGVVGPGDTDGKASSGGGPDSLACGPFATATTNATGIGPFAQETGLGAVAVGNLSSASGGAAVAIGSMAAASGPQSQAIGDTSVASGTTSTAIGAGSRATDEDAVALGQLANASGFHSTAVGAESVASGRGAQSFGWQSSATGNLSGGPSGQCFRNPGFCGRQERQRRRDERSGAWL